MSECFFRLCPLGNFLCDAVFESGVELAQPHFRKHFWSRLPYCAKHSGDFTGFITNWRVRERKPRLLFETLSIHDQRQVFPIGRLASQSSINEGAYVGPDFRPNIVKPDAQGARVLCSKDFSVGIV